jgi:hypothetical protein
MGPYLLWILDRATAVEGRTAYQTQQVHVDIVHFERRSTDEFRVELLIRVHRTERVVLSHHLIVQVLILIRVLFITVVGLLVRLGHRFESVVVVGQLVGPWIVGWEDVDVEEVLDRIFLEIEGRVAPLQGLGMNGQ